MANTRTNEAKPSSPPEDFSVAQYDSNSDGNSDGILGWQPPLESNGVITEYIIRYTTDKASSQIDAFSSDSDWLIFQKR